MRVCVCERMKRAEEEVFSVCVCERRRERKRKFLVQFLVRVCVCVRARDRDLSAQNVNRHVGLRTLTLTWLSQAAQSLLSG